MVRINKEEARAFLLGEATSTRFHKFTQVSGKTLRDLERSVKLHAETWARHHVASLPSRGKTI